MKFKNTLLLILPLLLLNVSSCNNNSIEEDVLSAKKLVVQADDVISYIPLNSEYLPGESVTFQITSSKLSTQEFKVYLNDEELVGLTDTTYIFTMPSKDSILKAELRNITKKVEIIETGFFVVDLKDNKTVYDVNSNVFFNVSVSLNYTDDISLKGVEVYYLVDNEINNVELSISSARDYKYSFVMPKYDVFIKPIYENIPKYTVSLKETSNIKINLSENKTSYKEFDKVIFTLDIRNGAILKNVIVKDEDGSTLPLLFENNEYSFFIGNKNVTIEVFERSNILYTVSSIIKPKYGKATFIDNKNEFYEGDVVSFKITPSEGYIVSSCSLYNLSLEGVDTAVKYNKETDIYSFTMVDEDLYIDALFNSIYKITIQGPSSLTLSYLHEKEYYVGGETVEFKVLSNDLTIALDSLTITYNNGNSNLNIEYEVTNDVYSFLMPSYNVTITLKERVVSGPSSNPFNDVSKFQATITETYYDEWDDYYTTTLTYRLTFDFNGDGTFNYTAYYVEGKETKKVFDHYSFTFDEETLNLNMAMGFSQDVKKDYFKAIKDSDGNISSFKALIDIDPHNGLYTIKANTIFKKI